jgi:hypothetical protein
MVVHSQMTAPEALLISGALAQIALQEVNQKATEAAKTKEGAD